MTTASASPQLESRLSHLPAYEPVRQFNEENEREYITPLGIATGVTSVLSATRDNSELEIWRENMGTTRADFIRDLAAFRGTAHHTNIENYLRDGLLPTFSFLTDPYWRSTWPFIQTIETTLLQEGALWHPLGFAGTCDAIAYLPEDDLQPTLLDWKTSDRPLKKQKIYDYCLQVAAYVAAANYVYASHGLNITRAVIVIAVRAQQPQIERLDAKALVQYFKHFQARLQRYTFSRTRRK